MRWDALEAQPPNGGSLTARLAMPALNGDVYIGIDSSLRRRVLVRVPPGEPATVSERASRGIAVQTVEMKLDAAQENEIFVEVACLDPAGYAALDVVVGELATALSAGASIGRVRLVQNVLAKWRRFWSGVAQQLSREAQLGLFGELWFIEKWLIPSVGAESAIEMWRGPSGSRNDFEAPGIAIEVKTTSRLDGSHRINGLEQLLEPQNVMLLLFSLSVREEASSLDSLPRLVAAIRKLLEEDHSLKIVFDSMLSAAGYDDALAQEYERLRFRVRGEELYRVSTGFPRLVPSSLVQPLPPGVGAVAYDLRLDAAGSWLLSDKPGLAAKLLSDLVAHSKAGE